MRRSWTLCAVLALGSLTAGCSFEHAAGVEFDSMIAEGRTDDGRGYRIRGFVHSEAWTPAFLYVFPMLPSKSSERAKDLALARAREIGADAITDVRLHVETHMPFLWIAGWMEHHISATAVKYDD